MSLHTTPITVTVPDSMAVAATPKLVQKIIALPPHRRGCHLITPKAQMTCLHTLSHPCLAAHSRYQLQMEG
ncbi:UPF0047 protein YjbQ-like [Quillaja saponaria]|uniref:UPF0047 protein YjbQ-like n=1 Tax=Quillaja saponaria TaxID=32244 RepID=A0AAD7LZA8_QUISA|nr:UPF0047 protein YjbQ-like [Quillaja saponaria]